MIALGGWSLYRGRVVHRRKGRQAVERTLADRGETLVSIAEAPMSALMSRAGIGGPAVLFHVVAQTSDGALRTYDWVYERALLGGQPRGLKRLAHGVWIALA
jgi:hypothetical protein